MLLGRFASHLLCLTLATLFLQATSPAGGSLRGKITNTEGVPQAAVFLTAKNLATGVAVTVLTDQNGRYRMPSLRSAEYDLTAKQIGYETVRREGYRIVDGGSLANFRMRPLTDLRKQMPSSSFLALLSNGPEKSRFILDCTGCHQFDLKTILSREDPKRAKNRQEWIEWTQLMVKFFGAASQFPIISPSQDPETTADWLVAEIGQPTEFGQTLLSPRRANLEASDVVITEYDLPEQTDLPHDLVLDSDGNVVITGMSTHKMYKLHPGTGTFADYPIPVQGANPRAVEISPDGKWWVLLGLPRRIASYDPSSGEWKDYEIGMYPHGIALDDGRIWFNGHFTKDPELIGYLDVQTGEVTTYKVPVEAMPDGGSNIPYGLRRGPDGTLWGTELVGNRLIKFSPETAEFTLYELPTLFSGPRRPDVGPDGAVWIPEYAANKLARFDPSTETFVEYELPIPDSLPYIARVDHRTSDVWVATAGGDFIARFDLNAQRFVVYPLPTQGALIRHMHVDHRTSAVWAAYGPSPAVEPKIVRLELRR